MAKKGEWFDFKGVPVRWWDSSPANRAAYCEARVCKGVSRRVERDAPRLEVDNNKGRVRVKSKGKKNQWVCQLCAGDVPRRPMSDRQGTLL
ncbi:MAG: hypothetical protein DRQ39_10465 [Gammaproteobacteria bacterium]|nr:MAG: hypothetical protein DRQ39_10465 [Gammaproteobacteria bacterium]